MATAEVGSRIHLAPALRDFDRTPAGFPVIGYCRTVFIPDPDADFDNLPYCRECVETAVKINYQQIEIVHEKIDVLTEILNS